MSQNQECTWTGASGKQYQYSIHKKGTTFKALSGNYIFAKVVANKWQAIYVGQTSDLSERFDDHHKMPCIDRHGATDIHVHVNDAEQARLDEEADIIRNYQPPCNG